MVKRKQKKKMATTKIIYYNQIRTCHSIVEIEQEQTVIYFQITL
jgi:hypothetical protein